MATRILCYLLSLDEGHTFRELQTKVEWCYYNNGKMYDERVYTASFVSNDCVSIPFHFRYMIVSDAIKLIIEYIEWLCLVQIFCQVNLMSTYILPTIKHMGTNNAYEYLYLYHVSVARICLPTLYTYPNTTLQSNAHSKQNSAVFLSFVFRKYRGRFCAR